MARRSDETEMDEASVRPPAPDSLIPSQRERRYRIVRAALELLDDNEYDKIQMRDVAQRAGVALGTVYRYFVSKEHLFAAVMLEWSTSMRRGLARHPLAATDDPGRLKEVFNRALSAFERRPQFQRVQMVLQTSSDPEANEIFKVFTSETRSGFAQALRDVSAAEAAVIIDVLSGVMSNHLLAWGLGRETMTEALAAMDDAIDLIWSPPPGARPRRARGAT